MLFLKERLETYGTGLRVQDRGTLFEGNFAEIVQFCFVCHPLIHRDAVAEGFFVLASFALIL